MKTSLAVRYTSTATVFLLVLKTAIVSAQLSTNAQLTLIQTNTPAMSLTITNFGDEVWTIQS